MTKKLITLILLSQTLTACTTSLTQSKQTAPPDQGLIIGQSSSQKTIYIRTIDQGEVLWVSDYKLGNTALTSPGEHQINVMCEFTYSGVQKLLPGNITLTIQAGTTYHLDGKPNPDQDECDLSSEIK